MNNFGGIKKSRQELASRLKQAKGGVIKSTNQDMFPFEVPNLESLSPEIKQYINQLEKEYIERYNTLINNRIIYEEIVENLSAQLDEKGVTVPRLSQIFKSTKYSESKQSQP